MFKRKKKVDKFEKALKELSQRIEVCNKLWHDYSDMANDKKNNDVDRKYYRKMADEYLKVYTELTELRLTLTNL